MEKLQLKQDRWKHLQVNLVIAAETTPQRMHRRENLSSGEIRKTSHQENGDCYESVPDKETGYRVGTEKRSSAVSSVGWLVDLSGMQTLQAPVSIVVTVSVHCWINMLAIAIF